MAHVYKTIGNTTAVVVSLLTLGTVCWWQRPSAPINAPQPQDEAEIMTAALERHYAMGRKSTKFTTIRPAYVITIADSNAPGGARYVTNSVAFTLTNSIGFSPDAPSRYSKTIKDALMWPMPHFGTRWLSPPDAFYTEGIWDVSASLIATSNRYTKCLLHPTDGPSQLPYPWSYTDGSWWTQRVALSSAGINMWTPVTLFPFEYNPRRDIVKLKTSGIGWSKDVYNDMGRAVSIMQFQNNKNRLADHLYDDGTIVTYVKCHTGNVNLQCMNSEPPYIRYDDGYKPLYNNGNNGIKAYFYFHKYAVGYGGDFITRASFTFASVEITVSNASSFKYDHGVSFILPWISPPALDWNGLTLMPSGIPGWNDLKSEYYDTFFFNGESIQQNRGGILKSGWSLNPGETFTVKLGFRFESTNDIVNFIVPTYLMPGTIAVRDNGTLGMWTDWRGGDGGNSIWTNVCQNNYAWTFGTPQVIDSFYHVQFNALTNYLDHAPPR